MAMQQLQHIAGQGVSKAKANFDGQVGAFLTCSIPIGAWVEGPGTGCDEKTLGYVVVNKIMGVWFIPELQVEGVKGQVVGQRGQGQE